MSEPVDPRVAAAALGKEDAVEETWLPNVVAGNSIWDLTRDLNAPKLFGGRLLEPDVHGRANLPDEVTWDISGLVPLEALERIDPARATRALEDLFAAAERTAAALEADPHGFGRYRAALTLPDADSGNYFYSPEADAVRVKNWGATARRAEHRTTHVSHALGELRAASRASMPPGVRGADGVEAPEAGRRGALGIGLLALLLGLLGLGAWWLFGRDERPSRPPPPPPPEMPLALSDAGPPEPPVAPPPPIPTPHQRVFFAIGDDTLTPEQTASLEAIDALLRDHPRVTRLRIEGHADVVGREENNRPLSGARAERVRRWLIERGLDPDRVEAAACSEQHPLVEDDDDEARRQNRRVEFFIVAPPGGPAPHEGCALVER